MKKNFLVALFILVSALLLPAKAVEQQTGVTFIYINGSNNLTFKNFNFVVRLTIVVG